MGEKTCLTRQVNLIDMPKKTKKEKQKREETD